MSLVEGDIGTVVVTVGHSEKKKGYERNARFKRIRKMAKANSNTANEKYLDKLEETPKTDDKKEIPKDVIVAIPKEEVLEDNVKTAALEETLKDKIEINLKDTETINGNLENEQTKKGMKEDTKEDIKKENIEENKDANIEKIKVQPESQLPKDEAANAPDEEAILFSSILLSTETSLTLFKEILKRYSSSLR